MDKLELLKTLNLLYVEDDKTSADLFLGIFEDFFKKVYYAIDGKDAMESFEKNDIHVIITDVMMPNMNGLDFIKRVRELNENIPIFVTSSYSEQEQLLQAIKLKLSDYIIKPLNIDKIKEALETCVVKLEKESDFFVQIDNNVVYSPYTRILSMGEKKIRLQNKEALLLELFIKNRTKLVTKDMIALEVYGDDFYSEGGTKNLIMKLRKKIGSDVIETVKNSGYILK